MGLSSACMAVCSICHVSCGFMWFLIYSCTCMHLSFHPSAHISCACMIHSILTVHNKQREKGKCILTHYATLMKLYIHRRYIQFVLTSVKKKKKKSKHSKNEPMHTYRNSAISVRISSNLSRRQNTQTQP